MTVQERNQADIRAALKELLNDYIQLAAKINVIQEMIVRERKRSANPVRCRATRIRA